MRNAENRKIRHSAIFFPHSPFPIPNSAFIYLCLLKPDAETYIDPNAQILGTFELLNPEPFQSSSFFARN